MSDADHPPSPAPLWRNRDFLILQSGQLVSSVGNGVQFMAVPLLVLALTGSPATAGLVIGLNTAAVLATSLVAGALIDRVNRKHVMIVCDAGRMLAIATVPAALWLGHLTMAQLVAVVLVTGVLGTCFNIANAAAVPNLVRESDLDGAIATSQFAHGAIRPFTAVIGGSFYALGVAVPFLVNAVSFGVSVLSLGLIDAEFQQRQTERAGSVWRAGRAGLEWLWRQPLLRFLTAIDGADGLRYGAGYLVIIVLAQRLHTPVQGIGAIFTAAGVGALLGNAAGTWARRHIALGTITVAMLWLEAVMFPLYAIAPNAVLMGLIAAAEEFVSPIYTVAVSTLRMTAAPDGLRGRVTSAVQLVTQGAQSLGALIGGLLIQSLGAVPTALVLGGWLLALALITTANGRVRTAP